MQNGHIGCQWQRSYFRDLRESHFFSFPFLKENFYLLQKNTRIKREKLIIFKFERLLFSNFSSSAYVGRLLNVVSDKTSTNV